MYLTSSILHVEKLEKGSFSYKNHVTPPKQAFQGEVHRGEPNKKQLGSGIPPIPDTPQVGTEAPAFCVCHKSLSLNSLSVKSIFHLLIGTPPSKTHNRGLSFKGIVENPILLGFNDEVTGWA